MRTTFTKDLLHDFNKAKTLEWLETNGLGGYASGTVAGAHTRRYHGLLVPATHPPVGRVVAISKLEETLQTPEGSFDLGANQYPGAVHPTGFTYLSQFDRALFPQFTYDIGRIRLRKTIVALHDENTTAVLYEVLQSDGEFTLELTPLAACRDYHSLAHANEALQRDCHFEDGTLRFRNYSDSPELFVRVPGSTFREKKDWYYNFEYAVEQYRGLDFREDLYTHGVFSVTLRAGDQLGILLSTENPAGRDAFQLVAREKARRTALLAPYDGREDLQRLALAADQFIVKRGDLKTIIAGYHWFSDWGRDTMIALPGLCLVTQRFTDAQNILRAFAHSVSEGMLPNRFPDQGETPEYNTIDATWWFFQALYKYHAYTKDLKFIADLIPVLKDIIHWHDQGTRYQIRVDPSDELLSGGQEGVQLTWMDAKVGDWVVTPRSGKAVEINALWYNALRILEAFLKATQQTAEASTYGAKADRVKEHFVRTFWNSDEQCLFDCVHQGEADRSIRPNQLYAVGLPFPLLTDERALSIVKKVEADLVTPRGLRSLTATDPRYIPVYGGDPWHRDGSYHQGTVWSFLIGIYVDALIAVRPKDGKKVAQQYLTEFFTHLDEGCIGSVSEIFDAAAPHTPRGCVAQAWGVGEVLRVAIEHNLFPSKKSKSVV